MIKEVGQLGNRDFTEQFLLTDRNCHTHGQLGTDRGQEDIGPHLRTARPCLAQYPPARKVDLQKFVSLAALPGRQTHGEHLVRSIGDVDRRKYLPSAGVRIEHVEPERRRLPRPVMKMRRYGGEFAPGAEQVHFDLPGDGSGQRLVTAFDIVKHLWQADRQEQRGDQQQGQDAGQHESRCQPEPQGPPQRPAAGSACCGARFRLHRERLDPACYAGSTRLRASSPCPANWSSSSR